MYGMNANVRQHTHRQTKGEIFGTIKPQSVANCLYISVRKVIYANGLRLFTLRSLSQHSPGSFPSLSRPSLALNHR